MSLSKQVRMLEDRARKAERALDAALSHCVANRGSANEFYGCHTYNPGDMPKWVRLAKDVLDEPTKRKVTWK